MVSKSHIQIADLHCVLVSQTLSTPRRPFCPLLPQRVNKILKQNLKNTSSCGLVGGELVDVSEDWWEMRDGWLLICDRLVVGDCFCEKSCCCIKGAYIKYVGGGRGFYKFFRKHSVAQGTIELNISWLSNLFQKNVMLPPINVSFLSKAWLW